MFPPRSSQAGRRRASRPTLESLDARRLPSAVSPLPRPHPMTAQVRPLARMQAPRTPVGPTDERVVEGRQAPTRRGRVIADIVYTRNGSRPVALDLYLPGGTPPPGGWPLILAFPGGGWRPADRKDYGGTVAQLTRFGYAVAGVDYTYASASGGRSWPANIEDAREAVRWARTNAGRFGLDPGKIVAMGESSGAHLALLLGTDPGDEASRVQAVVDFYGPTDLTALYGKSRAEVLPYFHSFLGGPPSMVPDRYADASPLTHVSDRTPPILIMQGLADRVVDPSQSVALDAALTENGVRHRLVTFAGITHGFRLRLGAYSLVPDVVGFLRGALDGGPIDRAPG